MTTGSLVAAHPRTEPAPVVRYPRWSTGQLVSSIVLFILGTVFLVPFLWLLSAAFGRNAGPQVQVPQLSLTNFEAVFTAARLQPLANSFYLAAISTLICTGSAVAAGYVLSRRRIPLKRGLMLGTLFATGLPVSALLVPAYELYVKFNWLDSLFYTSLFLAATALPFAIWLMKNFIDQIPKELDEAAQLEGASALRSLIRVVLPGAVPGILVTAIVTFINGWGAFLIPLVLNSNPSETPGSIAIYQFLRENYVTNYGQLAAYSILFALPVVVLYLAAARQLTGAFTLGGGVKG